MAAEDLHAEVGGGEAEVGEERLDDRRHQRDEIVRLLARLRIGMALGDVEREPDPEASARAAFGEGLDGEQMRRTSGWTMIGSAGLSGASAPVSARPCSRSVA